MPPKDSGKIEHAYFYEKTGEGEYRLIGEIGHIEEVSLFDNTSMFPRIGEDMYSHFIKVRGGTRLGWVMVTEALWNGNFLYYNFPKKGRRKLAKYARKRRKNYVI